MVRLFSRLPCRVLVLCVSWRVAPVPVLPVSLEGRSCSVSPGGPFLLPLQSRRTGPVFSVSGHVRGLHAVAGPVSVSRRTPEFSAVQGDCFGLRTHWCSEFAAVQGNASGWGLADGPVTGGRCLPIPLQVQEDCFLSSVFAPL